MARLSQLLALPDLGLRLVQAGAGDPEISWVSTTELIDLSEHLEGGELIMTTGLALGAEDPRWRDFVASLSRARVAAIGFGIGVNHDRIPQPLIHAASTYRVALFEIPLPTPFVAVSKAVAELLRTDELRAARGALQAQQRLLSGAYDAQSPAEVLASVSQATGRHLALLGSDGALLASTGGFAAARATEDIEYIALDQEGAMRLAVAGTAPLSPEGRSVIAAGSIVLGLGLRGARADETRERERWERFTGGVLAGTIAPDAVIVLSPRIRLPERIRAIAVQGTAEDVAAWRRRPRTGLERFVSSAQEQPATPGLALAWQLADDTTAAVQRALDVAAEHNLDAVVGRPADADRALTSRRSASARLSALSTTAPLYEAPRVPQVVRADRDTPILEALLDLGDGAATNAGEVLGPLSLGSALDPEDRDQLRATLRAVFLADGQRGPAAATLGIHRNTLRDRIARIERLTGRSFANADDRAELWLAYRLEESSGAGRR
ncbi:PucR family transcriptional regulator ligand-binding domain-containing protein [Leucobacter sp. CSA2]|uniref:PucR family transcriptional regulator ligand-binding domain-containing protein n=1 Tax=Leucobacter edaphi TaxID=2796472 RepID=A0A934QFM3_9MICO|nr:PucR family transcriptional regulator [Leucobacter edaphi]MBK0422677.1 PucR family transcriptional regulator ligand-binding domain-containing protein [Leucobacter edaphi]